MYIKLVKCKLYLKKTLKNSDSFGPNAKGEKLFMDCKYFKWLIFMPSRNLNCY